ncbi:iron chelate uptake ABC transporter family permease subunit [Streptomyces sp. SID13666]|uniref:iron chelate uptake ABC transporter family permease subunit n=1 Tax=Streptomyces TaxID=1883 RepID=UPI001105B627|nr:MULTISPECIES: iron chelate uptake ABC transporter family permease subunit [unclassified Streptomyces]NEA54742.1 iron chelate uptake ABC transporter family permease subunit [Streptomyces sp. SID13666]NEA70531.1 iron chelate uptake ABC transporter family permease subunit [Streptomyces sp. SID13588]QNA77328.1 iron chelate uptake ABC transporter family permease subunit [Streptomyces sp. So13.3]
MRARVSDRPPRAVKAQRSAGTTGIAASDARRAGWLLACVALLAVACLLSIAVGTRTIGVHTTWDAFAHYTGTDEQTIVRELRVPRLVLGLLTGVALGVCGALIQAVTRNPLADTQILGVNAGAALFVVFAVGVLGLTSIWSYVWFAFAGVAVAMVAVYALGSIGRGGATPVRLTLAGVALGAVMDGLSAGIRLVRPRAFDYLRFWDVGTLGGRPMSIALAVAPFIGVGLLLALTVARSLNAVAMGDDIARSLGADITRTRVLAVLAVMLLAGASTAAVGPIGFVGLMVPHAVRWLVGPDQRWILAFTVVCAPVLMLSADVIGRLVIRPAELQAGIVTAFVGAPVLIWMVRRSNVSAL